LAAAVEDYSSMASQSLTSDLLDVGAAITPRRARNALRANLHHYGGCVSDNRDWSHVRIYDDRV
jgi:hypothetical protein